MEASGTEVESDLQTGNFRQLIKREWYGVDNCRDAERDVLAAIKGYSVDFGGGTEWHRVTNYDKFEDAIENAIASHKPSKDTDIVNNSQPWNIVKQLIKILGWCCHG